MIWQLNRSGIVCFVQNSFKYEPENYRPGLGKTQSGLSISISIRLACETWYPLFRVRKDDMGMQGRKNHIVRVMTPHPIFVPESPDGWEVKSSRPEWMITDLPIISSRVNLLS